MALNYNSLGYRDILSELTVRTGGGTIPTLTNYRGGLYYPAFSAGATNETYCAFHLNHDYAMSGGDGVGGRGAIFLHIHWSQIVVDTGNVVWGFEYSIARGHQQAAFPAPTTVLVTQAGSATQYQHMIGETVEVSTTECEPDSLILCRIYRDGGAVGDTNAQLAFGMTADIHYQCDHYSTKNRAPNFYT